MKRMFVVPALDTAVLAVMTSDKGAVLARRALDRLIAGEKESA